MKRQLPSQAGGALLAVLLLAFCVLTTCTVLYVRIHQAAMAPHRDAAWVQALYAAHAGLDVLTLKLGTLANPVSLSFSGSLARTGEGAAISTYKTELSVSPLNGLQALRLRSTGRTALTGGTAVRWADRVNNGPLDRLRPFYLTRYQGQPISQPFAERTIEAVLSLGLPKWKYVLQTTDSLRIQGSNSVVDSYDSEDPSKSAVVGGFPGQYEASKRQENALLATMAPSLSSIQLNGHIFGSVSTHGIGLVSSLLNLGSQLVGQLTGQLVKVTGAINTNYQAAMQPPEKPTWTPAVSPSGADLQTADRTLRAGPTGNPMRYKFTEVSRKMRLALPDGHTTGEVEVWVTGNINSSNAGDITVAKGVKATIYFENGLSLNGKSIVNENRNPAYLTLLGVRQSGYSAIDVNGAGELWALLDAPLHTLSLSGGQHWYGSFNVKSAVLNNTVGMHYDEALIRLGGGALGLKLISYLEDLP